MIAGTIVVSRLSAITVVFALVAAALAVIDMSLSALFGSFPPALMRSEYLSREELLKFGGRVVAVSGERRKEVQPAPLGVILGFSTAREGLVPEMLDVVRTGQRIRWLNLAGSGGSFYELAFYVRPLFESELRPQVLVLGVHSVWLAGR